MLLESEIVSDNEYSVDNEILAENSTSNLLDESTGETSSYADGGRLRKVNILTSSCAISSPTEFV